MKITTASGGLSKGATMPILSNVKTTGSEVIWQKGDRTIYKVSMEYEGKPFVAKSYSDRVAAQGFSGDVEVYEKQGTRGAEQFVRQAPKEEFGGSTGGGSTTTSSARPSYTPKDEKAIQAMWAIGQAVQLVKDREENSLDDVYVKANALFAMVDAVKAGDVPEQQELVHEPGNEAISLEDIDAAFRSDMDDKPWHPGSR
jgi:hypothetical protein